MGVLRFCRSIVIASGVCRGQRKMGQVEENGSGGKPGSKTYTFVRKNRPFPGQNVSCRHFVRKYPPFSGQNVLGFAIVLTLIMKIQSHRKTVTKNAFFYTVCHKNEKRGKIRLFFTPFVRYSAAECSLIPVIVIASGVCRLFTNDYFCRLV